MRRSSSLLGESESTGSVRRRPIRRSSLTKPIRSNGLFGSMDASVTSTSGARRGRRSSFGMDNSTNSSVGMRRSTINSVYSSMVAASTAMTRPNMANWRRESEHNILAAADIVSVDFTLDNIRKTRNNTHITKVELEDVVFRNDSEISAAIREMLRNDGGRDWGYIKFVDTLRLECFDVQDSELMEYEQIRLGLWKQIREYATEKPVVFELKLEIVDGMEVGALIELLGEIHCLNLVDIKFLGALYGFSAPEIANELAKLCVTPPINNKNNTKSTSIVPLEFGTLQQMILLHLHFTSGDNPRDAGKNTLWRKVLRKCCKRLEEGPAEEETEEEEENGKKSKKHKDKKSSKSSSKAAKKLLKNSTDKILKTSKEKLKLARIPKSLSPVRRRKKNAVNGDAAKAAEPVRGVNRISSAPGALRKLRSLDRSGGVEQSKSMSGGKTALAQLLEMGPPPATTRKGERRASHRAGSSTKNKKPMRRSRSKSEPPDYSRRPSLKSQTGADYFDWTKSTTSSDDDESLDSQFYDWSQHSSHHSRKATIYNDDSSSSSSSSGSSTSSSEDGDDDDDDDDDDDSSTSSSSSDGGIH